MPLAPGSTLGPYSIEAPLGAGGMGEVYRARDTRLARDVAIKGLPQAFAASPDRLARFRREAQTLAALNHPNIGAIYGLEESEGAPFLVLELVAGESLTARLARGPLPVREALALGIQIALGVEAAHEQGIVHRDLKPGNVMITPSGVAKVLDFGLATTDSGLAAAATADTPTLTLAAATQAGMLIGTAAYMSPEQARGRPVDRRSDVWSFGCVLFECLTARPAFEGETVPDLLARILEREPDWATLPAETPKRVRELLRRCLRRDAEQRPRDIRDVRLELAESIAAPAAADDAAREHSIAVLPFENLSGPDDEYFADGITDEILNALAQLEGLRVAARTSCFAFKGKREDLRTVGERLDVRSVLQGSVRRAGSRLRIQVQLANAADGYQMWSERYDREMTDVFELQDEIAGAIAAKLRGAFRKAELGSGRRATQNLEAYELLLRGRALQGKRGRFLAEAVRCFERALELDPEYAEALAWLSDSYRLMGIFGTMPPGEALPKAKEFAERALAIDPRQAEATFTFAAVIEQFERDFERGEAVWVRGLELDPRHSRGRAQHALWALARGFWDADRAIPEARRAVEDDPLSAWVVAMLSHALGFAGRHEESLVEAERAMTIEDDSFFAQWNLVRAHAFVGHYAHAIDLTPALLRESGRHTWGLGVLGWCYGNIGDARRARAVHDELEARSRHEWVSPFWLTLTASAAGDEASMIRNLERAVVEHDPLVLWGRASLFWDGIRGHPRFEEIVRGVWK